jgi:hypothetical protein
VKPPSPPPRPYFVNPWIDFLLVGGGSILIYVALAVLPYLPLPPAPPDGSWLTQPFTWLRDLHTGERSGTVTALALTLTWVCNWPHFSASTYRLYHAGANVRQYPMTALVVPWVVLAGVVASFASPTAVAPYFVKLFRIWSPYHFSGQTLGVTLIYARRQGFKVGPWERLALSGFIFGTFLAGTARAESGTQPSKFWGIPDLPLGLPEWAAQLALVWMWLAGFAFLALAARWCFRSGRPFPPIVLLPAVTQYVWFVQGSTLLSFAEFVPFFHSLQYLLVAWSVQLREKMDHEGIQPSSRYVLGESLRWGALNLAGGAALFYFIPWGISAWGGYPFEFATGVFITGVQIHHFFVDGVIWKLKNKNVASPLMGNVEDLLHAPPLPAAVEAKTT